jgi:hypothetical protein
MIPVVHGTGYGGREQEGALMAIDTPLATGPSLPPGDKPPRRWPWMVGLLVLGLVTAAIALVVTRPSDGTTPGATVDSTIPVVDEDAVIIQAYEDAQNATIAAFEDLSIGPDYPPLAETMTDPLLNYVRHQITDLHSQGIYYEPDGLTNRNFHVVERDADRAVIRLCENQHGYGYNDQGERQAAPGLPGEDRAMEAIAVRDTTGVWKISTRYPKTDGKECEGV